MTYNVFGVTLNPTLYYYYSTNLCGFPFLHYFFNWTCPKRKLCAPQRYTLCAPLRHIQGGAKTGPAYLITNILKTP